jgi:hypothetical protein
MSSRPEMLAARRERLIMRSGQLRQDAVEQAAVLRPALTMADQLQEAWWWLRAHPEAIAGGVLALALWRPRRVFNMSWRAWSMWKLYQRWQAVGLDFRRFF